MGRQKDVYIMISVTVLCFAGATKMYFRFLEILYIHILIANINRGQYWSDLYKIDG